MAAERHLFVFWRWPGNKLAETLEKIETRFEIEHVLFLKWTPERTVENFQRFYAMISKHAYEKYAEADTAPFLYVLGKDHHPVYRYRNARGSGLKKVNINSFDLKQALREQGKTSLHATNDQEEYRRDLMLLMGQSADVYAPPEWNGNVDDIPTLHRDIYAAEGWKDLRQVFSVLNEAVPYVVLRNFEGLPDNYSTEGDIDLLVGSMDARNRAASILNKEQRGTTLVGNRKVAFDFRCVEDFYFDPEWCRRILADRVMVRGLYVPCPEDHFFSLLYHAHIQKPSTFPRYLPKLAELAAEIGLEKVDAKWLGDADNVARLLGQWLKGNGFYLTRPAGWPNYDWKRVRRSHMTPVLYQSMPVSKKIGHIMQRSFLLRPLVPPLIQIRNRISLKQRARKKSNGS